MLVQCKAVKGKAGPEMVREVEGAVGRREHVVGVLCGKGEATKGVRDAVRASTVGLVWVRVCDAGRVRQLLWNERVGGKIGMGVGVRYVKEGSGWGKEAVLTWDGGVWEGRGEAEEKTEIGFEDSVGDGG